MMKKSKNDDIDPKTYYDYTNENVVCDILGSYVFLTGTRIHFICSVLYTLLLIILYTYVIVFGTHTIFITKNKSMKIQVFFDVSVIFCSFGVRASNYLTRDKLIIASSIIRSGVFKYSDTITDEYIEKKRVCTKRLRIIVNVILYGIFISGVSNMLIPLLAMATGIALPDDGSCINPYLPFHICSPLDTRTPLWYRVEFIVHAIVLVSEYMAFVSHEELISATSLQIITELKVLRFSLDNIARRAYGNLKEPTASVLKEEVMESMFQNIEFQQSMYLCLRDNARHYIAILRLRSLTNAYVERAVTACIGYFGILFALSIIILIEDNRPEFALIVDVFGFFPVCFVGQLLLDESRKTRVALNGIPWPDCSKEVRSLFRLFVTATERPMDIKPKGFDFTMNFEAHADLVSLGYKFVNVMR